MKPFHFLFILLFISSISILPSCEKDTGMNNQNSDIDSVRYSGILVGSSGYYTATIKSNGKNTALVHFDGETYHMENQVPYNKGQLGQIFVFNNQEVTLTVISTNERSKPEIEVSIPGHSIVTTVYEETSGTKIRNYTGTAFYYNFFKAFVDSSTSIYNLSIRNDSFTNIEKVISSNKSSEIGKVTRINGTIEETNNEITFFVSGNPNGIRFDKNGLELSRNVADTPSLELNWHEIIKLRLGE